MIDEFFRTGFGWIAPHGEVLGGDVYSHVNILKNDAHLPEKLRQVFEEIEDAFQYCSHLADSGEHPEWHRYDMAAHSVTYEAYKVGYIRLGVNIHAGVFGVEGKSEFIHSRMDMIQRLKDQFEQHNNVELRLRVTKGA